MYSVQWRQLNQENWTTLRQKAYTLDSAIRLMRLCRGSYFRRIQVNGVTVYPGTMVL